MPSVVIIHVHPDASVPPKRQVYTYTCSETCNTIPEDTNDIQYKFHPNTKSRSFTIPLLWKGEGLSPGIIRGNIHAGGEGFFNPFTSSTPNITYNCHKTASITIFYGRLKSNYNTSAISPFYYNEEMDYTLTRGRQLLGCLNSTTRNCYAKFEGRKRWVPGHYKSFCSPDITLKDKSRFLPHCVGTHWHWETYTYKWNEYKSTNNPDGSITTEKIPHTDEYTTRVRGGNECLWIPDHYESLTEFDREKTKERGQYCSGDTCIPKQLIPSDDDNYLDVVYCGSGTSLWGSTPIAGFAIPQYLKDEKIYKKNRVYPKYVFKVIPEYTSKSGLERFQRKIASTCNYKYTKTDVVYSGAGTRTIATNEIEWTGPALKIDKLCSDVTFVLAVIKPNLNRYGSITIITTLENGDVFYGCKIFSQSDGYFGESSCTKLVLIGEQQIAAIYNYSDYFSLTGYGAVTVLEDQNVLCEIVLSNSEYKNTEILGAYAEVTYESETGEIMSGVTPVDFDVIVGAAVNNLFSGVSGD